MNLLEKSILATVAYYDVVDHPLTGFEIFKYLISPAYIVSVSSIDQHTEIEPIKEIELNDIINALDGDNLKKRIGEQNGFYYLKKSVLPEKQQGLRHVRIQRQKISDKLWKKTRRIVKWMQFIPYIRMVMINGSMAMYNAKEESDIDLMIVTKDKRIWTARFFTTLFFQIIGQRRHGRKIKNRFCLNHYITKNFLKSDLSNLYTAQLYAHLIPILELEKDLYSRFQFENRWIGNYLCFYDMQKSDNRQKIKSNIIAKYIRGFKETILNTFIGNLLEKMLGFFQKKLIKKHLLLNQKDGRIVFNNNQLEFHPNSQGIKILREYKKIMSKLDTEI